MKTGILSSVGLGILLMTTSAHVQQSERFTAESTTIVIAGTSTLHDWEMKSTKGTCNVQFTYNNAGAISGITSLSFSTPAEGLKSGKSAMDNNAYKALKTDQYKDITFTMTSGTVTPLDANTYNIKTKGKLTIAGTSRDVELTTTAKAAPDKTLTCTGNYKLGMKDYNVTPPSFMMGAVKTGNDITISYTLKLKH